MSTYSNNIKAIEKLLQKLDHRVSDQKCHEYFKNIFDEYDSKWESDLHRNHWKKSRGRVLLQVNERLETCNALTLDIESNIDSIRRYKYPALITYLKLTCFDKLGQPTNYMQFNNWLKSKRKKTERELIISDLGSEGILEQAEKLYNEYLKIYGVKNSFYRFINEVIPDRSKQKLLDGIEIKVHLREKKLNMKSYNIRQVENAEKIAYLYQIRNDYTHNTFSASNIFKFTAPREGTSWIHRESVYKSDEQHSISFHEDFDISLTDVILDGISEIIRNKTN